MISSTLLRGVAGGLRQRLLAQHLLVVAHGLEQLLGQISGHAALELRPELRIGRIQPALPVAAFAAAAQADDAPGIADVGGNIERRVLPAEFAPGRGHFVGAKRRAMSPGTALLVGRAVADDRSAGDEARPVRRLGGLERLGNGFGSWPSMAVTFQPQAAKRAS
jgi:hypothetical protein